MQRSHFEMQRISASRLVCYHISVAPWYIHRRTSLHGIFTLRKLPGGQSLHFGCKGGFGTANNRNSRSIEKRTEFWVVGRFFSLFSHLKHDLQSSGSSGGRPCNWLNFMLRDCMNCIHLFPRALLCTPLSSLFTDPPCAKGHGLCSPIQIIHSTADSFADRNQTAS